MDNFTPLRNGLIDHIQQGRFCPFDLGIYTLLHLRADWATGIYQGCALSVACQFGDPALKKRVQKSLSRMRQRQYINFRKGDGTRGGYPILIHKYQPRVGGLLGTRLNAWKHGELCQPEYEPWNGDGTVEGLLGGSEGTVEGPYQEVKKLRSTRTEEAPSCAELGHKPASAPPVLLLPCKGQGPKEYPVTADQIAEWSDAFPAVEVLGELKRAKAWLDANPNKQKTHRGMARFIVNWLSKEQDRGKPTPSNGRAYANPADYIPESEKRRLKLEGVPQ